MQEIISNCPNIPLTSGQLIHIAVNPPWACGLRFNLHTRIFIFKDPTAILSIDFIPQQMIADCFYIVPPLHFHALPPGDEVNFICIDIDNAVLNNQHRELLYAIKYKKQKSLPAIFKNHDDCRFADIAALSNSTYDEVSVWIQLKKWIENRIPQHLIDHSKAINSRHVTVAEQFLDALSKKKLTLESCTAKTLAHEMFCTERTLLRICKNNFGLSPREIIRYHFISKAIYLLAHSERTYADIAADLQFSSTSSFHHYMKKFTGFTSSQIRLSLKNLHS